MVLSYLAADPVNYLKIGVCCIAWHRSVFTRLCCVTGLYTGGGLCTSHRGLEASLGCGPKIVPQFGPYTNF